MNLWAPGFKLHYFSMSILRGSVTVGEVILFIDASLARDQAPPWGKRRKKSASEASREVVWGGKRAGPPFPLPQVTPRLASFADIFPIWPRFLPFSPTVDPGPRLMTVTLWNLRNYLWMTKSQLRVFNTSYQSLQTTKLNFENLLGQQGFQNHNKNLLNLLQVLQSLLSFVFVVSFTPSSNCVWAVIFKVSFDLVPWVPEVFPRVQRGASSATGRRHERDRNQKPRRGK